MSDLYRIVAAIKETQKLYIKCYKLQKVKNLNYNDVDILNIQKEFN